MLKVQLLHPSLLALTVNPDPEGLEELELAIKRSDINDGVFFEFTLNLGFNKAARAFIHSVEAVEGIDAEVTCNVFQYDPNTYKQEIIYTGQIKMSNFKLSELDLESNIEQSGFERNFINLSERDINLESLISENGSTIPATPVENIVFHSKDIVKRIDVSPINEDEFIQGGQINFQFDACATVGGCDRNRSGSVFGNIDGSDTVARELETNFNLGWGFNSVAVNEIYQAKESGTGQIDISLNLKHRITAVRQGGDIDVQGCDNDDLGQIEIAAFYSHVDSEGTIKVLQQINTPWIIPICPGFTTFESAFELKTYQQTDADIEVGDKIAIYYTLTISATYQQSFLASASTISHELGIEAIKETTFIRITQNTIFPPTTSKVIMVYEAAEKMCQFMTNQQDCFRSDFFGRTDTSFIYAEDGAGSLIAITNGSNIRGVDTEIFTNWVDFFQSFTSLYCLGWGFETLEDGTQIIRLEPKPFFYDKGIKLLSFGQVTDLFRTHDTSRYFGKIEYGYPKLENIKQINGIDEFNEVRKQSSPLSKTKGNLDIRSIYRAAGYEIESQRRLQNSNEDSRLDDEIFIVTVIRDGGGFKTETDELFSQLNNVFSPETIYNARISPGRNLQNWAKILGGNLIKGTKKEFKFAFGSFNYIMTSQITGELLVDENAGLDTSSALDENEVIYYPEIYEFEHELTRDQYQILRANPNGFIEFLDWNDNISEGFLLQVDYKLEENKGTFTLLRLYRKSTS